jgi:hypothetical protein
VGIQNSRIMGPWSLLPRFLRKAWEAKQHAARLVRTPEGSSETAMHEAVRVTSKLPWRPQNVRDASYVDLLPRKVSGTSPRERPRGLQMARP